MIKLMMNGLPRSNQTNTTQRQANGIFSGQNQSVSTQQLPQSAAVPDKTKQVTVPLKGHIEQEPVITTETKAEIEAVSTDVEVSPELERIGVRAQTEAHHVPPDLQKIGVRDTGAGLPVTQPLGPKLPIADEQIAKGLHARLIDSLRWLAEWCIYRLKKAHIHLKKIGGQIIRVRDD